MTQQQQQHTPGPWATEVDRFETHIIGSDFVGGSATIATVYVRSNGPDAENVATANARLIAAAPDLLALAEQVRAIGDEVFTARRLRQDQAALLNQAILMAKAAIARAGAA